MGGLDEQLSPHPHLNVFPQKLPLHADWGGEGIRWLSTSVYLSDLAHRIFAWLEGEQYVSL